MSTQPQKLSAGVSFVIGVVLLGAGYGLQTPLKPVAEAAEKMGLPLDLAMTVSVLGVFFVLFPVINFFFIAPLGEAIHARNSNLEHTFAEAETLRAEMHKMRSDYEAKLAQTEADARAQIQAEVKKAQELRAGIMAEATANADTLVKQAQDEISAEKAKALTEIRTYVVDLTMQATSKVIGENMDNDRNRKLVQDFIDTVEVRA